MRAPKLRLDALSEAGIDDTIATNLVGVIKATRLASKAMLAKGGGQIVNVEDIMPPGLTLYDATKRPVTYFTKSVPKEFKGASVQIGLISPGVVAKHLLAAEMREASPAERARSLKLYNIPGDRVETVAPLSSTGARL